MSKIASELEPVTVSKEIKKKLDERLGPKLHTCCRGRVGPLQPLQLQGNPLLSFAKNLLQSTLAVPLATVSTVSMS